MPPTRYSHQYSFIRFVWFLRRPGLANPAMFRFMIRFLLHLPLHLFKCRCFALGAGDPLFRHKLFFNTFKELLNMLKTLGYFIPMSTYVVGFNLRGLLPFILVISNAAPQASTICSNLTGLRIMSSITNLTLYSAFQRAVFIDFHQLKQKSLKWR